MKFNSSGSVENESCRVCNVKLKGKIHGMEFRMNQR